MWPPFESPTVKASSHVVGGLHPVDNFVEVVEILESHDARIVVIQTVPGVPVELPEKEQETTTKPAWSALRWKNAGRRCAGLQENDQGYRGGFGEIVGPVEPVIPALLEGRAVGVRGVQGEIDPDIRRRHSMAGEGQAT